MKTPTVCQPEIPIGELTVGQSVRVRFKSHDNSYREVVWTVRYCDERSAILDPIHGHDSYTRKGRLFDADEVRFIDASVLLIALQEVAARRA